MQRVPRREQGSIPRYVVGATTRTSHAFPSLTRMSNCRSYDASVHSLRLCHTSTTYLRFMMKMPTVPPPSPGILVDDQRPGAPIMRTCVEGQSHKRPPPERDHPHAPVGAVEMSATISTHSHDASPPKETLPGGDSCSSWRANGVLESGFDASLNAGVHQLVPPRAGTVSSLRVPSPAACH